MSLLHKINLAILVTFLLMAVAYSLLFFPLQARHRGYAVNRAVQLLKALVEREMDPLSNEVYEKLERAVQIRAHALLRLDNVLSVTVFDSSAAALAHADRFGIPPRVLDTSLGDLPQAPSWSTEYRQGIPAVVYEHGLYAMGECIGYLRILYSMADWERERRLSNFAFVALLIASLAVMLAVLNSLLFHSVRRPIAVLQRAMDEVEQQGPGIEVELQADDEIGALARAFNRMSRELAASLEQLRVQIAERKEAEKALRRSEEDLSILLDSIADAVIATDTEGRVVRMNPVAATLTGWSEDEARGRPLSEVFRSLDHETREPAPDPAALVLERGDTVALSGHRLLVARDGREHRIVESGAPIRGTGTDVRGVVLAFHDITEEIRIQQELRHSQKMDSIGQLAGGVAHDFNNMLGAIMGATEVLAAEVGDDRRVNPGLGMIVETCERAAALTGKLLAFSRKGPTDSQRLNLDAVVKDVIAILSHTIDKRIEVKAEPARPTLYTDGDRSQIQNALLNLAVNARDAMPSGGTLVFTTARVDVEPPGLHTHSGTLAPGAYARIRVADTGTGIAHGILDRIFEPFFTTKEVGKGTGLGLTSVYTTAKDHGGAVDVQSRPGEGTVFDLYLPLATQPTEAATETQRGGAVARTGRVLVADDEEMLRKSLTAMLVRAGFEVETAKDGREAVDVFVREQGRFELVLMDMVMPRMGGRDAMRLILEHDPDARILIISGFSMDEDPQTLVEQGAAGFLQKPFRRDALLRAIADCLEPKP
jgi:PAS domain S-box-containing protein